MHAWAQSACMCLCKVIYILSHFCYAPSKIEKNIAYGSNTAR